MTPLTVTVSQVNRRAAFMFKGDASFSDIRVKGEISNFKNHTAGLFFTLKDGESALKCVMFRSYTDCLRFLPEDGQNVIVRGEIKVYERDGVYQLYAAEIEPDGIGSLYLAYAALKEKLEKGGYFSQKRPLPERPGKICVITSETGAVLQDIRSVLERRYPFVSAVLIPAVVQGKDAPASIMDAFKKAQTSGADLIIFGRGGGSIEDLWAFNDEGVALAVYGSKIPTISAVGHETDFTIADFAADKRAPTPSAAAELAVPDIREVLRKIEEEIALKSPEKKLKTEDTRLSLIEESIKSRTLSIFKMKSEKILSQEKIINALNPRNVLLRGYALVYGDGGKLVRAYNEVKRGETVKIILGEGSISAVAEKTESV